VLYPNVDKLVANGKKIFVKFPARIELFKKKAPETPLPPMPVITHWETWLDSIVYYAENIKNFCSVVKELTGTMLPLLQYCKAFKDSNELKVLKFMQI
jgi:hypothetical protein